MADPVPGDPVWYDARPGRPEPPAYPPPTGDTECDVLVVGAGVTGAAAALELATVGVDVLLVDFRTVAGGTSGASTAKVSALQGTAYSDLLSRAGTGAARAYARLQLAGLERVAEVAAGHEDECGFARRASWVFAEDRRAQRSLEAEQRALAKVGLEVERDADAGLPFPVSGTLRMADQALVDPVGLVHRMVADAVAQGARVAERTRVVSLHPGDPHRARTAAGATIRAGQVVVATQYPTFERGLMFTRLKVHREHVLCGPCPDADLPDMYVSAGSEVRTLRRAGTDPGAPLLVSGSAWPPGDPLARREDLTGWAVSRLPAYSPDLAWSAQDFDTEDGMPHVGALQPLTRPGAGIWTATGFGGWGFASGVAAGGLLRDLVLHGELPAEYAGVLDPLRARPLPLAKRSVQQGTTFTRAFAVSRLLALPGDARRRVEDLAPGEGTRVRVGTAVVAVHRDEAGALHAVQAACPHLGCLVDHDPTGPAWECPCHGSRFGIDGTLLQGPATTGLDPVDLEG